MISIKLLGGLGNQMFQYAAAKNLAELRGTELGLDLSWFENIPEAATPRKFELDCFNISGKILTGTQIKSGMTKLMDRFRPWRNKKFYQEPHYHFDSKFFELGNDVHLTGYFQSEKYFNRNTPQPPQGGLTQKDLIRKEFIFKEFQVGKNKEVYELIRKSNSVSLHIRRGDYVSDANTNKFHGVCDLDYYQKCIQEIEKDVENPHFFVFSDDITWVKENLKIEDSTEYIDHNSGEKSYEDMRLMSQCKHNIIANSSFSWWGAWLNENPNKIVFAPQRWFADDAKNTKDVIPEGWRRV